MNSYRLKSHIKLCTKNLKSDRVICCAGCPFEDEILAVYPGMKRLFEEKRKEIGYVKDRKRDRVRSGW